MAKVFSWFSLTRSLNYWPQHIYPLHSLAWLKCFLVLTLNFSWDLRTSLPSPWTSRERGWRESCQWCPAPVFRGQCPVGWCWDPCSHTPPSASLPASTPKATSCKSNKYYSQLLLYALDPSISVCYKKWGCYWNWGWYRKRLPYWICYGCFAVGHWHPSGFDC